MPNYYYQCPKCEAKQTETYSIEVSLPNPSCPSCQTIMKRLYSPPAVTFKGTGWGRDPKKNGN